MLGIAEDGNGEAKREKQEVIHTQHHRGPAIMHLRPRVHDNRKNSKSEQGGVAEVCRPGSPGGPGSRASETSHAPSQVNSATPKLEKQKAP
ncbi:hypothetical protein V6N11_073479 [Hibiscus sabdariffa]|uniref:Uncharacterized protein n=2 Tax=Hibiscus sabdariffa TaxID=183260 RepID=A0ABR2NTI3_9ROSI